MSLKSALLIALSLTSGCSIFAPKGPTEVARGEYYSAGKPEYDAFFIQLHDQQVLLLAAPDEPAQAKKSLAQVVELGADVSNDELSERLTQALKKLAGQGLRVRLEVPEPSQTLDASATLYAEGASATPLRALLSHAR